jgi:hypothetical protein
MKVFGTHVKLARWVKETVGKWLVSRKVASCLVRSIKRRKGDSLACLVFNLALEKAKRDSGIQTRGKTFYKPVQLLAFANLHI